MKTNSELRKDAKARMSGNWTAGVMLTLVVLIVSSLFASISYLANNEALSLVYSIVINLFLSFPLTVGLYMAFLSFARGEELNVSTLFGAFNRTYYKKSVVLCFLMSIYTCLWMLLLIIPGFIKSLSYSMAPYILIENPDISAEMAIRRSMAMMNGHKMDLFVLGLSFIGWGFPCVITLGIASIWVIPYMQATYANAYNSLKPNAIADEQPNIEAE